MLDAGNGATLLEVVVDDDDKVIVYLVQDEERKMVVVTLPPGNVEVSLSQRLQDATTSVEREEVVDKEEL